MNITNKRSFIHTDRKTRTNQTDLMKKERIRRILRMRFNLVALGLVDEFIYVRNRFTDNITISRTVEESAFNQKSFFEQNQVNRIDLFLRDEKPQRIIELDGPYHGFGDITSSEQTLSRKENYALGGFTEYQHTLVILTDEDLQLDDEHLTDLLSKKLDVTPKTRSEDMSQRSSIAKPCLDPNCGHFSMDHQQSKKTRKCYISGCTCKGYQR